jgi:hypothetical protein
MDIFIQTESNNLIPITIEAHWTVGDLKDNLREYSAPLLSYQGAELKDPMQELADTGICSESVVNMISRRAWMLKCGSDVVIIDTKDNEIHLLNDEDYDLQIGSRNLTKLGYGKYKFDACEDTWEYQLGIEFTTETRCGGVNIFYPVESFDIKSDIEESDVQMLESLRQKYTEFTFNDCSSSDRFDALMALATRGY